MITSIHSRALLVNLSISTWSARKYDKRVSQSVNEQYHASTDAGRYNKFLLPGETPDYKTLVALMGSIRAAHYARTLAWSDEGWRTLPSADFTSYTDWYRAQLSQFVTALDAFVAAYPQYRDNARVSLNSLYRDEDYPSTTDIRSRFAMDVSYRPIPIGDDIRTALQAEELAIVRQSIESNVTASIDVAMKDAWMRLHGVVQHMADRLSQPDAIFRNTLIDNAREVCAALQTLNIMHDADLETMRQRVSNELAIYAPDDIRADDALRSDVATKADAILADMRAVYGGI
jgi:hypothetical protein